MEALKKDWIKEAYQEDRFISSFAVKFDSDYAREEKADWKDVITCLENPRMDYMTKKTTRPMKVVEGFNEISYYYAENSEAGIMVFHDEFDDRYYVGLIQDSFKDLFDILLHKLMNENNSNKFVHLRRVHAIPEDYKPVRIQILKKAA